MRHRASQRFWACYNSLSSEVKLKADRCFEILKEELLHPSIHFKIYGRLCRTELDFNLELWVIDKASMT
jgi:hypothetical protein